MSGGEPGQEAGGQGDSVVSPSLLESISLCVVRGHIVFHPYV